MLLKIEQVMLVRQTYMPGLFQPGGGLKRRETLEQAARREVCEEIGAEISNFRLLRANTHFGEHKSDHNALFLRTDFILAAGRTRKLLSCAPSHSLPFRSGSCQAIAGV